MLVEREDHLTALRGMFSECRAGHGRVAVITGPVSCGKTELLHAFTAHPLAIGSTVLGAVGSRAERDVALGIMGQLFCSARLRPDQTGRALELVRGYQEGGANGDRVLHELGLTLLHAMFPADVPVVLTVEDAHYADGPSLQCLTSIIRRLRSVPVMLVLTQVDRPWSTNPAFQAELPLEPMSRRMRLSPLSALGVSTLISHELGPPAARRHAGRYHALTGGNPLLLRGLIEDNREQPSDAEPVVGPAYSQAFLNALYRCESSMLRLAHATAVLDAADLLCPSRLAGLKDEVAWRAAGALNRTGLLAAGRFRHPEARAAVLDDLGDEERRGLHIRAARLLRQDGAPATAVAQHLLAAQDADGGHGLPILVEAARQAYAEGDLDTQLRYLRLACEAEGPGLVHARTTAALARAEWRIDPSIAFRHTPELMREMRLGRLAAAETLALTHRLLWFGHENEAAEVLRLMCRAHTSPDPRTAGKMRSMAQWLRHFLPEPARRIDAVLQRSGAGTVTPMTDLYGRAATSLAGVLVEATRSEGIATAEQILQGSRLDEATFAPICMALLALNLADRQSAARSWCDLLLADPQVPRTPTWHALLSGIRARIALAQGDLPGAEEYARTALEIIPVRSWGVAAGLPLGVLIEAYVGMSRLDEAAELVDTPLPAAAFHTPAALGYLRACSRLHLARGHFEAALADAHTAGELASRWRLDHPALIDWRTDAAYIAACMGLSAQAREVAQAQLALLGSGDVRVRARTQHVLALTEEGPARSDLLQHAVQALRNTEARLELAYALVDLGRAQHAQGHLENARQTFTQARRLSRQCGVPVPNTPGDIPAPRPAPPGFPADDPAATPLSDAELRVAVLAARGHSNREIATKLFVTVSTVEQHLTRVYRKLQVNSRSDLHLHIPQGDPVA